MSIGISCPACAREYHVNVRLAGKRVRCRACGAAIRVPVDGGDRTIVADRSASIDSTPLKPVSPRDSNTTPEESSSAKPRQPGGVMRRVYLAIAVLIVLGFFGLVYVIGREAGLWGEPNVLRSQAARVLTPEQKIERDRYMSRANLIRIGLALEMWARSHRGMYPANLVDINEVAELTSDVFHSPFTNDQTPGALREVSYRYLYVRSMGVAIHNSTVIAYDAAELAGGQGASVLYGSGEVKWVRPEELAAEIAHSEAQRLGVTDGTQGDADKLAARSPEKVKPGKRRRD